MRPSLARQASMRDANGDFDEKSIYNVGHKH